MKSALAFAFLVFTATFLSQGARADGDLTHFTCQAVNALGSAGIGLGTQGDVLIQTTSVAGIRDDHYTVSAVARTLEKARGSYVHLINKDEKQPGVFLSFARAMETNDLKNMGGYLYSVKPDFKPGEDSLPAVPVALVTCSLQF